MYSLLNHVPYIRKAGWEWVSEVQVDRSKRFGNADEEGWMYGLSFDALIEKINAGKAAEQNSSSVVRRRRFVRSKKCVAPSLIKSFQEKFTYFKQEIRRLKVCVKDKQKNHMAIELFEKRRVQAYQWSSTLAANKSIELVSIFKDFLEKLSFLKSFLDERLAIELEYATKMSAWSQKWKTKSIVKPEVNDLEDIYGEEETPGLFCILGSAGGIIAEGVNQFVGKFSEEITSDIDSLIRELHEAIESGTKGASDLWAQLKQKESKVSKDFMVYKLKYKMCLDKATRDIMTLTDCFARADSVGYLLVEDLLAAVASCGKTIINEGSDDFYSSIFNFPSFTSDTESQQGGSGSADDYYEVRRVLCFLRILVYTILTLRIYVCHRVINPTVDQLFMQKASLLIWSHWFLS